MCNVLIMLTENTLFTSMPIMLGKVVFSKNYTPTKIPRKHFSLKRDLHLPNFVIILTSGRISALYIESTENLPFFVRFHWNLSEPSDNWTDSNQMSKAFRDACLVPTKLRLNETSGGEVPNTFAIVSLLFRTIAYRAGYCSLRADWPRPVTAIK